MMFVACFCRTPSLFASCCCSLARGCTSKSLLTFAFHNQSKRPFLRLSALLSTLPSALPSALLSALLSALPLAWLVMLFLLSPLLQPVQQVLPLEALLSALLSALPLAWLVMLFLLSPLLQQVHQVLPLAAARKTATDKADADFLAAIAVTGATNAQLELALKNYNAAIEAAHATFKTAVAALGPEPVKPNKPAELKKPAAPVKPVSPVKPVEPGKPSKDDKHK